MCVVLRQCWQHALNGLLACVDASLLLQVDLADSCVLTLSGSWQGQMGWDGWGVPGSSSGSAVRELVDAAVDRVRWWAEQCDRMQGELLLFSPVLQLSVHVVHSMPGGGLCQPTRRAISRGVSMSNSTACQFCTLQAVCKQQLCALPLLVMHGHVVLCCAVGPSSNRLAVAGR
jgi:hypothetical protein